MKQNLGEDISHLATVGVASSMDQASALLNNNNQLAVNNIAETETNLEGRNDKNRHTYWTNTQSGMQRYRVLIYSQADNIRQLDDCKFNIEQERKASYQIMGIMDGAVRILDILH